MLLSNLQQATELAARWAALFYKACGIHDVNFTCMLRPLAAPHASTNLRCHAPLAAAESSAVLLQMNCSPPDLLLQKAVQCSCR